MFVINKDFYFDIIKIIAIAWLAKAKRNVKDTQITNHDLYIYD